MFNFLSLALSSSVPAEPSAMEPIFTSMADVFSLVCKIVTQITVVPVLLFFLAAGLVPVGIGIFKRLKRAAK